MWILIIILIRGSGVDVETQEFSNQTACEAAAVTINAKGNNIQGLQALCVRKY